MRSILFVPARAPPQTLWTQLPVKCGTVTRLNDFGARETRVMRAFRYKMYCNTVVARNAASRKMAAYYMLSLFIN